MLTAIGLLLGGVVGLGAGYKIERDRTRSDVRRLTANLTKDKKTTPTGAKRTAVKEIALLNERIGRVTKIGSDTITVQTKRGRTFSSIHTTNATRYEQAAAGKRTDIAVGRRILTTTSGSDAIVLAQHSALGLAVSKVASNSVSLDKAAGRGVARLSFAKMKVIDTISTTRASDIKSGSMILAGGQTNKGTFDASEVILLPSDSGFAN